jgi:hypothetical protein
MHTAEVSAASLFEPGALGIAEFPPLRDDEHGAGTGETVHRDGGCARRILRNPDEELSAWLAGNGNSLTVVLRKAGVHWRAHLLPAVTVVRHQCNMEVPDFGRAGDLGGA